MKTLYKIILYIGLAVLSPFIWFERKMTKKKAAIKYSNIVGGFVNVAFPNKKVEHLAKARASICAKCPHAKNSEVVKKIVIDNRTKEIRGMYCDVCGCNLTAKVRSQDSCPKGKW